MMRPPVPPVLQFTRAFGFGASLIVIWLFVDRTLAGFVQCASAGSCPW